ncbi:MAG: hydrogenase 4 subunit B [Acidobacteria bacterium]|nr:hydrogenase 4 subunit B [Acidobacteriota bacterium]
MSAAFAFGVMLAGFGAGAAGALVSRQGRTARLATAAGAVIGSLAALGVAAPVLVTGTGVSLAAPGLLAAAGGLAFHVDALGAFFLAVVAVGAIPASIHGASSMAAYERRSSLRAFGFAFNLFVAAMCLVPSADNALTFLLAWELMSVASYFLVMTDAADSRTRHAGLWYLAMTELGLMALLPMFALLAPGADRMAFADLRAGAARLPGAARGVVFVLALLGFGSKAGLVPLHIWLPRAHPAAPSHVSALMSGVMIKLGIYGLIRVVFDLMGGGPPWWGGVLLIAGSISALLGVLYALMEHDLKRLLAYHSVENIGIIVIGLGAGSILHSYGLHGLAAIGFAGALFHTLNHACFKGLLFLGAGNVLHQAHTRNMEEMGGLVRRMPVTSAQFLIGSAAIAALPPLNGFASEWMVFQALLAGTFIPHPGVAAGFPVAVGMLALTSGLAAACFVKAFGITFLAMPRSRAAAEAAEASGAMTLAGWLLAGACVMLGIGASFVVPVLYGVLRSVDGLLPAATPVPAPGWWIAAPQALGHVSPVLLAVMLGAAMLATFLVVRRLHARPARAADTWGCGRIAQTPRMEYTATAFAEPLRRVFAELYRPTRDLTVTVHPDAPRFVQSITYRSEVRPWIEQALYTPLIQAWRKTGSRVRGLQAGSVHLYLVYVMLALIAALTSAWWFA